MKTTVHLCADSQPLRPGEPSKWNAALGDEPLLTRSRDPEHDACRELLARGVIGSVTFIHTKTGNVGLSMDIEKGAGLTIRENTNTGRPRTAKYQPFVGAVPSPARVDDVPGIDTPGGAVAAPARLPRIEGGRP